MRDVVELTAKCPVCGGSGRGEVQRVGGDYSTCRHCGGSGVMPAKRAADFKRARALVDAEKWDELEALLPKCVFKTDGDAKGQ